MTCNGGVELLIDELFVLACLCCNDWAIGHIIIQYQKVKERLTSKCGIPKWEPSRGFKVCPLFILFHFLVFICKLWTSTCMDLCVLISHFFLCSSFSRFSFCFSFLFLNIVHWAHVFIMSLLQSSLQCKERQKWRHSCEKFISASDLWPGYRAVEGTLLEIFCILLPLDIFLFWYILLWSFIYLYLLHLCKSFFT